MKKIRIQVQGGLGNQLFIWAMAHEIAISTGKKVELVYVVDKNQRADRPNELTEISNNCTHGIALKNSYLWGYIFKMLDKSEQFGRKIHSKLESTLKIHSCSSEHEITIKSISNQNMIRGFFQNSELVNRHKSIISMELQLTLSNIHARHSRAQTIHIRRGDTTDIANSWGILSENYYDNLIMESSPMVVCTDSVKVANSFASKYPTAEISTPQTDTTWQTLKMLSQGDRFIGGNSTLSWWSAWLVTGEKRGVAILPTPWRPGNIETSNYLHLDQVTYHKADFENYGA